jgi:hypothetical protein
MSDSTEDDDERGYDDAIVRLREWIASGDYKNPTPFADALYNLYTFENGQRQRLGDAKYFACRDTTTEGRVVGGIVYARGLKVHARALTVSRQGQRPFTLGRSTLDGGDTLNGLGVILVWVPFARLPLPAIRETHDRDEMYQRHVEGRNAMDTFEDAKAFFELVKTAT